MTNEDAVAVEIRALDLTETPYCDTDTWDVEECAGYGQHMCGECPGPTPGEQAGWLCRQIWFGPEETVEEEHDRISEERLATMIASLGIDSDPNPNWQQNVLDSVDQSEPEALPETQLADLEHDETQPIEIVGGES